MVSQTRIELIDDIDGKPAATTRTFTFNGRAYELDLSEANSRKFDEAMRRWLDAARPVASRHPRRTAASRQRSKEIRRWAVEQGIMVTASGRLAAHVVAQWEAAQKGKNQP